MKRKSVLMIFAAAILVISGCGMFQDTGVNVTNNTGASITVTVFDTAAASSGSVADGTVADGATTLIDLSSVVPLFGSVTIGGTSDYDYEVTAEGNYCYSQTQGVNVATMGTTDSVTFNANAAYVTITNNTSNTFTSLQLASGVAISGTTVSSTSLAPGQSVSIPVMPSLDYLVTPYSGGVSGRDLNIITSEIGTNVSYSITQ